MLETILNKLTLKELGIHLSNYANLYIKPISAWKKAIEKTEKSYDFIILHLVYFTILLLIILKDLYQAIPLCLVEIILTIFPFLIFIIPYLICCYVFKKEYHGKLLFKLLLVVKLQGIPILFLLYKFANHSQSEHSYILVDNFIFIICIGYIIIFPLVSNLRFIQKIVWIIINYISFLLFCLLLNTVFSEIDLLGNLRKDTILTPYEEYTANQLNYTDSTLLINDRQYLLTGKEEKPNLLTYKKTQFVDINLSILINEVLINKTIKKIIQNDSIICSLDKNRTSKKDSLKLSYKKVTFNKKILDSLRNISIINIKKDIWLSDSLSDHAKFKTNREYYLVLKKYLIEYYNSYHDNDEISRFIKNSKKKEFIKLDNHEYAVVLDISPSEYSTKKSYIKFKEKMEKRNEKANFIMRIFFYPFEIFLEKFYL